MRYYPINLDIANKRVLVVGGGNVALRKIRSLLRSNAYISVRSPKFKMDLIKLASENRDRITLLRGRFASTDLNGKYLAIGATNDKNTNQRIADFAKDRKLFCNIVDDPELCSFTLPSIITRGNLLLTISTGGDCPALSKSLRLKLSDIITEDYKIILEGLADLRTKLKNMRFSSRKIKKILNQFISSLYMNPQKKVTKTELKKDIKNFLQKVN